MANTIVVMTEMPEKRVEWSQALSESLQLAHESKGIPLAEYLTALLSLIYGQSAVLPPDHLYTEDLADVQRGLVAAQAREVLPENLAQKIAPPFDTELITRSRVAFHAGPAEKMAHMQYLTTLAAQTTDEGTKKLIEAIQFALLGGDLSQQGSNLDGVYRRAWEAIVADGDVEATDNASE